jgi:hypothetical protein
MNQGVDVTFARKTGSRITDAERLAATVKSRLPFSPMDIPPFFECKAKASTRHIGYIQFETMTMLPHDNPQQYLDRLAAAIRKILQDDGWEVYGEMNNGLKVVNESQQEGTDQKKQPNVQSKNKKIGWAFVIAIPLILVLFGNTAIGIAAVIASLFGAIGAFRGKLKY